MNEWKQRSDCIEVLCNSGKCCISVQETWHERDWSTSSTANQDSEGTVLKKKSCAEKSLQNSETGKGELRNREGPLQSKPAKL